MAEAGPFVPDTSRASIARVYDVFLGGKDNYAVDREAAAQVAEAIPQTRRLASEHRAWQGRVIRYLAGTLGIRQFLDCGCGLPTRENTHEVARRHNPEAVTVYVDNDSSAVAHGQALLDGIRDTYFVDADLTRPDELFAEPTLNRVLDRDAPIALIQCATIHYIPDAQDPQEIMRGYRDLLASGSHLALTHWYDPPDAGAAQAMARFVAEAFTASSMTSPHFRSRTQIAGLFGEFEFVEPGLTLLRDWWPDGPQQEPDTVDQIVLAGVARKP